MAKQNEKGGKKNDAPCSINALCIGNGLQHAKTLVWSFNTRFPIQHFAHGAPPCSHFQQTFPRSPEIRQRFAFSGVFVVILVQSLTPIKNNKTYSKHAWCECTLTSICLKTDLIQRLTPPMFSHRAAACLWETKCQSASCPRSWGEEIHQTPNCNGL